MVGLFGPDGCYGLASSVMHLIETAPGWPLTECQLQLNNEWKIELGSRAIRGPQIQTGVCSGSVPVVRDSLRFSGPGGLLC